MLEAKDLYLIQCLNKLCQKFNAHAFWFYRYSCSTLFCSSTVISFPFGTKCNGTLYYSIPEWNKRHTKKLCMLYLWHSSSFIFFVSTFCEFNVLDCKEEENRTEKQNKEEKKENFGRLNVESLFIGRTPWRRYRTIFIFHKNDNIIPIFSIFRTSIKIPQQQIYCAILFLGLWEWIKIVNL